MLISWQAIMKNLTLLALLFLSIQVYSQSTIGVNFQGFLPTGELKKDAPEIGGFGLGLEGTFTIKQSPFHVGGLIEYNHFGSQVREGFHGPDLEDVRVKRNFENIKIMGAFRFKPDCGENIFPYFDLVLGPGNVRTRTSIRDSFLEEAFENYIDMDQWAFMYGFGLGNEFFLSDNIILDVFFRTIKSSRIEYFSPDGVQFDTSSNWYTFETRSSAFTHINFGFGIKFLFNEHIDALIEHIN